jgi:hypothetical protein
MVVVFLQCRETRKVISYQDNMQEHWMQEYHSINHIWTE